MTFLSLLLYVFGFGVTLLGAVLAAYHDARSFRIPNYISAMVAGSFLVAFLSIWVLPGESLGPLHPLVSHGAAAGMMFMVTFGLFAVNALGAGDAKFATALALWAGLPALLIFIFYLSLCGGVMGLLTLAMAKVKPFKNPHPGGWIESAQCGGQRVPYGVAITFGFIMACLVDHRFDLSRLITLVEAAS